MKTGPENPAARRTAARPRLFLSYRRRFDTPYARLLKDELTRAFGEGAVFRDVDDIEAGEAFPDIISGAVEDCDAFLLLISPGWIESAASLHDPADFVRREIAAALARRVPLIPVLLGDAQMPPPGGLPEEVRALAFRQAIELSDDRWDHDVGRLVKLVRARVGHSATAPRRAVAALRSFLATWRGKAAAAAAVLALLAAADFAARRGLFVRDFQGCVRFYTSDAPGASAGLRSGTHDFTVVGADAYHVIMKQKQRPEGFPIVLRLSDSGKEVGAVFFRFFKAEAVADGEFRVERVVEPTCADVRLYLNTDRPAGERHVLKNWDRLGVRLGGRDYLLRTGDHGDYIGATLEPAPGEMPLPWK